jgi:hypothetical protein
MFFESNLFQLIGDFSNNRHNAATNTNMYSILPYPLDSHTIPLQYIQYMSRYLVQ